MNTIANVLDLIVAKGLEYTLIGDPQTKDEYEQAITWHSEGGAPSWQDVTNGLELLNAKKAEIDQKKMAAQAKLEALGLTVDDLAALGL